MIIVSQDWEVFDEYTCGWGSFNVFMGKREDGSWIFGLVKDMTEGPEQIMDFVIGRYADEMIVDQAYESLVKSLQNSEPYWVEAEMVVADKKDMRKGV